MCPLDMNLQYSPLLQLKVKKIKKGNNEQKLQSEGNGRKVKEIFLKMYVIYVQKNNEILEGKQMFHVAIF